MNIKPNANVLKMNKNIQTSFKLDHKNYRTHPHTRLWQSKRQKDKGEVTVSLKI